jgi:hypothetical protein
MALRGMAPQGAANRPACPGIAPAWGHFSKIQNSKFKIQNSKLKTQN